MNKVIAALVLLLGCAGLVQADFPPIQGYGKDATGGAGQPVCTVTSSAESGPGTWDSCVSNGGNQVIQFAVPSATVLTTSYIQSNTTIDGCANGRNGVTLNMPANEKRSVILEGPVSNVIVRCLRFQGSGPDKPGFSTENDLLGLDGTGGLVNNVVVDHCTFAGATDGALDITGNVSDVTVSWNLFYNTALAQLIKYDTRQRISLHHNVYTANGERNPQIKGDARNIDFVSNVIYGMTIYADGLGNTFSPYGTSLRNAAAGSDSPGNVQVNLRSNFYGGANGDLEIETEPGASDAGIYIAPDNVCEGGCPASPASSPNAVPTAYAVTATPVTAMAYEMLPTVGAPNRTTTDQARIAAVATPLFPTVSITGANVSEGDGGYQVVLLRVSLSSTPGLPVKVAYATSRGTALSTRDYLPASGTLVFPPGTRTVEVALWVLGDLLPEATETFTVNLLRPENATIGIGTATVTLADDDTMPALTVSDALVAEGHVGSRNAFFRVTLSAPAPTDVSVDWTTENLTATAGEDYLPSGGTLTIRKGLRVGLLSVPVLGDRVVERNEAFLVRLSNAVGARIVGGQAQGVIWNDDGEKDPVIPIASLPYVARRPGRYRLVSDLVFAPAAGAAVTIAASQVVLDLDGHTLSGSAGAATKAFGVLSRNRSIITVENGTIQGFLAGVFLAGPPPYAVVSRFTVHDLHVHSSTYAGIWLEGRGNQVASCEVVDTGGTTALGPGAGAVGISSVGALPKLTQNQVLDTVAPSGGDAFGIAADGATRGFVTGNLVRNSSPVAVSGILVTRASKAIVTLNTLDTLGYGIVFTGGAYGTCQGNSMAAVATPTLGVTCLP